MIEFNIQRYRMEEINGKITHFPDSEGDYMLANDAVLEVVKKQLEVEQEKIKMELRNIFKDTIE